MIEIQFKWGANYLVYNEPIDLRVEVLECENDICFTPGQKVKKIGTKKRTSFEMKEGVFMVYEGLLMVGNLQYAVFNCTDWVDEGVKYRYAFATAIAQGKCFAFVLGAKGCRDISIDNVE